MIDQLKWMGMSDLEARCYLVLHGEPSLSGYEIAKRVSVSRTNVYSALRSLTEKGACRMVDGDPVRYEAVPVDELVRYFKAAFEQTAEALVQELKTPARSAPSFFNWQGTKSIEVAIHRVIANAQKSIVVDAWAEELHLIETALLQAEQRGVTVILITLGAYPTSLRNVFIHQRSDAWPNAGARKFSVMCDAQVAIVGSFSGGVKPSAVETEHPAVIELLRNSLFHDLLMQHIEADFGSQLVERYGEHYEQLMDWYAKEKGWKI